MLKKKKKRKKGKQKAAAVARILHWKKPGRRTYLPLRKKVPSQVKFFYIYQQKKGG